MAFQDSDDEWLPGKLEKQMQAFGSAPPSVGVVYTGFWQVMDDRRTYIPPLTVVHRSGDVREELLKGNFVGLPTAVVRRECFARVGLLDERLPRLQDWELFLRISRHYEFLYIGEPLVCAYVSSDSISADSDALVKALTLILEKHHAAFAGDRRLLARWGYCIGNALCRNGEMAQGRRHLLRAVRRCPTNVDYLAALLMSLCGRSAYLRAATMKRRVYGPWRAARHVRDSSMPPSGSGWGNGGKSTDSRKASEGM
jgi:hypothetical protein